MNKFMLALIESLSSEELEQLGNLVETELKHRCNASRCDCGAGYCPEDNVHYPCNCIQEPEWHDNLPF